jgi:NAD(P)-dependent dehydrogenase (short-subunit alcohol dehydrogenase family)
MQQPLDDRVMTGEGKRLTLITGGSRGIGHYLVQSYLADTDVLNVSRKPARTDRHSGHELHNLNLDLGNVMLIEPCLRTWFDEHPLYAVTTLVHNAATPNLGWLDKVSATEVDHAFRVNVHAPLAITTALFTAGHFAERGARVAYIVSSLGRPEPDLSFAGLGLYSVTKAALGRMALIQRREFELAAPHIKVLRIHPGIVDTDMQRTLRQDPRLDAAFGVKTADLPSYREGEWNEGRMPKDHMRTISAEFAAEFIVWVTQSAKIGSAEYDFYHSEEFHAARAT